MLDECVGVVWVAGWPFSGAGDLGKIEKYFKRFTAAVPCLYHTYHTWLTDTTRQDNHRLRNSTPKLQSFFLFTSFFLNLKFDFQEISSSQVRSIYCCTWETKYFVRSSGVWFWIRSLAHFGLLCGNNSLRAAAAAAAVVQYLFCFPAKNPSPLLPPAAVVATQRDSNPTGAIVDRYCVLLLCTKCCWEYTRYRNSVRCCLRLCVFFRM